MKNRKLIVSILMVIGLISITVGVSVAFFNYTRTGAANTISVGRISFVTRQTKTISLTNLFPIDPTDTEAMADTTKVGTLEIEIEGDTDYAQGVEYLISSENSSITTSTGKVVPISLSIETTNLGSENANYFTARNDKNATIYKRLVGDTITGDQMLLVGFIKPNTTSGTAEGIQNGKLTIKAYLDKNKIGISDTYDGTESGSMGTTNEWANGRTILTTTEWNALQSTGLSFQIKIEANEGIWVNDTLDNIIRTKNLNTTTNRPIMDNVASEFVTASTGINFGAVSSNTNGKGVYMRAGTENDAYPILYYRGAVEDNNVLFNNLCWKAVRTTDTGGVKLVYNGGNKGTVDSPNCNNTGSSTLIGSYAFNTNFNSPAFVGYMFGDVYVRYYDSALSGVYYGSGFTYSNGVYTLTNPVATKDNTHHYSCNLTVADGTCETIRYYYYVNYYVNLTGGDSIEIAMEKMQTNTTNSLAKNVIDSWYSYVMNTVTNKLEDTIWCNDRSIGDGNNNGWIANGGDLGTYLYYGAKERSNNASNVSTVKNKPSLTCTNKNDAFTVSNVNGNQKLTYPVALLTADEIVLVGTYLNDGNAFWSLSPYYFDNTDARGYYVSNGSLIDSTISDSYGLRPSVSLKPGLPVIKGTGTVNDPYVIG